jgi:hypothetical protein
MEKHNKRVGPRYRMKVMKTYGKNNMERKVCEAMRINRNKGEN